MSKRIISRIDIKNDTLVKGVQLEGLRTLGDPKLYADYYYDNGIDEIFLMDVVASLYERNSLGSIVKKIAADVFVPITVGGGIRSLNDISEMLLCGADKVSINTAAIKNIDFVKHAVKEFGSSTIVANVEIVHKSSGDYECFYDNGREPGKIKPEHWINQLIEAEVGEIVLTSVLDDGMGHGFDFGILNCIPENINVPLIVHGGIGKSNHICDLLSNRKVDGIALASILHYGAKSKIAKVSSSEGNYAFLSSGRVPNHIKPMTVQEIKTIS